MLIHKTKPSQADLLLEDAQDKKLVKQVQSPGEAILVTDYATPVVVSMPLCSRQAMETIAEMIITTKYTKDTKMEENTGSVVLRDGEGEKDHNNAALHGGEGDNTKVSVNRQAPIDNRQSKARKPARKPTRKQGTRRLPEEVIPLAAQRQKHRRLTTPAQLTVEMIVDQIAYRKQQEKSRKHANEIISPGS